MKVEKCYCGSLNLFQRCCSPYIIGVLKAPTALVLMKSRYSAYASHQADYLVATTHVSERKHYSKTEILHWAVSNSWKKLEILYYSENTVEFKAYFLDENNNNQIHHELSNFKQENGIWFYLSGTFDL